MISNIIKAVVLASIAMPSIATVANAEYIYHCRDGGKFAKCSSLPSTGNTAEHFHSHNRGIKGGGSVFMFSKFVDDRIYRSSDKGYIYGKRAEALKPFAEGCKAEAQWMEQYNDDYRIEGDDFVAERLTATSKWDQDGEVREVKITIKDTTPKTNIYGESIKNTKSISCFFSEDTGLMLNSNFPIFVAPGTTLSDVVEVNHSERN